MQWFFRTPSGPHYDQKDDPDYADEENEIFVESINDVMTDEFGDDPELRIIKMTQTWYRISVQARISVQGGILTKIK